MDEKYLTDDVFPDAPIAAGAERSSRPHSLVGYDTLFLEFEIHLGL